MLEDLIEVRSTNHNLHKPFVEWLEVDNADLQPYQKNAGASQTSKNENGSVTSETENCSTEGDPSDVGSMKASARSQHSRSQEDMGINKCSST